MKVFLSPLERLNYFNGQRLEASDFRLEQSYHMRVRRWLNKSLYTRGIAKGLEVVVKEGDSHRVVVSPGLALDAEGREIILLEAVEVQVVGSPSSVEGVVYGNYLVIEYGEDKVAQVVDGCAIHAKSKCNCKGIKETAWGGPSRIRSEPRLSFQDTWPSESSGKIVLAQIELKETCAVRDIHTALRKYVGVAEAAKVRTYALEGEKDIDANNSKQIHFHIRGGRPDTVTLYLRGDKFSTLYYTEMGQHSHGLNNLSVSPSGAIPPHVHELGDLKTSFHDSPKHKVTGNVEDVQDDHFAVELSTIDVPNADLNIRLGMHITHDEPGHDHTIGAGEKTKEAGQRPDHTHTATGSIGNAGVNMPSRTGAAHTYVSSLKIILDGTDYTTAIINRLGWDKLGDGTSGHVLVQEGTGPIQLELLGADLIEGEHTLELKVTSGGGRILYNLYVE
jgi:hypothetical protein